MVKWIGLSALACSSSGSLRFRGSAAPRGPRLSRPGRSCRNRSGARLLHRCRRSRLGLRAERPGIR